MSIKLRAAAAEEHLKGSGIVKRCVSDLDGQAVVEVEVRARPRWSRCASAPYAIEVSVFRSESRYHRLVFTAPEWAAFLADVKADLYNVVDAM